MKAIYNALEGMKMSHDAKFWDCKLPQELRGKFWFLIKCGFGGETAYHRTISGNY